ncbi:MAG: CPBP family intramembrane glutamic endopeptidase [Bacteroidota bacterium]
MTRWKDSAQNLPTNPIFQGLLVCLFIIPFAASLIQFITTGFLTQIVQMQIFFWPGSNYSWSIPMQAWWALGAMGLAYIAGIGWLVYRKSFGKAVLFGLASLIFAQAIAAAVNHFTGWKELQNVSTMDLAGKANRMILTLWHNPAWEEVVFRGIPLLCLVIIRKKFRKMESPATWLYFILPAIAMAFYHVPNHGLSRIMDTFLLSIAFSWMALRYSFFAPLVMHSIFDAMMVIYLAKTPNFPTDEIPWLMNNQTMLNTVWSSFLLAALLSVPLIILWNRFQGTGKTVIPEVILSGDGMVSTDKLVR